MVSARIGFGELRTMARKTKSLNTCAQLWYVCAVVHRMLYVERDVDAARRPWHLPALTCLVDALPKNDGSIVGAEGRALYYELCGDIKRAIAARLREVKLTEKLHESIRRNNDPEDVKKVLLDGRDLAALKIRRRIIRDLRLKLRS
jgi:hypothetical protein